jgi:hypothetical protein
MAAFEKKIHLEVSVIVTSAIGPLFAPSSYSLSSPHLPRFVPLRPWESCFDEPTDPTTIGMVLLDKSDVSEAPFDI